MKINIEKINKMLTELQIKRFERETQTRKKEGVKRTIRYNMQVTEEQTFLDNNIRKRFEKQVKKAYEYFNIDKNAELELEDEIRNLEIKIINEYYPEVEAEKLRIKQRKQIIENITE